MPKRVAALVKTSFGGGAEAEPPLLHVRNALQLAAPARSLQAERSCASVIVHGAFQL